MTGICSVPGFLFLLITLPFVVNRKNDWCVSKEAPDPFSFWKLEASKHDEEYNSSRTYAELHNVALVESDSRFGVLSFNGSNDSYVYMDNVNKSFSVGEYAMSWMMYLEPGDTGSRSTILKYQDQNGTVPFHLELLSDGNLSCTMRDTNGHQYNVTSRIKVTERKFIGVNFNFLWDKQFDFFHVYTADDGKQKIDPESLTLKNASFNLFLEDTTYVLIGSGFHGNISCIQFYNSSVIKSPLKDAPLLCDPVLAINDSFGDYTIDVTEPKTQTVLQFSTTITQQNQITEYQTAETGETEQSGETGNQTAESGEIEETSDNALYTYLSSLKTPFDVHTTSVVSQHASSESHTTSITSKDIYYESQTSPLVTEALKTQVHSSTFTPEANYPESQTTTSKTEALSTQVHSSTLTPNANDPEAQTTHSQTEALSIQVHASTVTSEDKFPEVQTTPLSKVLSTQIYTSSVKLEDKFPDAQTTPSITTLSSTEDNNVINERCVYFRRTANDTTIINPVQIQTATNLNDCAQRCWETTSCFQFSVGQEMTFTNCYIGDNTYITATLSGNYLYTMV
ncbi:uncharacterized protein LOC134716420 [Mytilus trossulus]|uniref:uncharacterized protein LOC134716420 n=1 Tax=Mytilus trossulus TaxID=6551 RepID=UPI003004FA3B